MKLTRNIKAISRLALILLLLIFTTFGALISYLWVVGYYESLYIQIPETPTIAITNATFSSQNTTFFNVTFLNPTFSASEEPAEITGVTVSTRDGVSHNLTAVDPSLPLQLFRGESKTFRCIWNWANYTGQNITIHASLAEGSGANFQSETPLVDLNIADVFFNSTISINHFNMTVKNSEDSATYVNLTRIDVIAGTVKKEGVPTSISLPYSLDQNSSVTLKCSWNWTNYQNTSVTVIVRTLQGYASYRTYTTPNPVTLEVTDVVFDETDTNQFKVTVKNSEDSPTYVNITRITVTLENATVQEINGTIAVPSFNATNPCVLNQNSSIMFTCPWNWTSYRDKNASITVHTSQGFTTSRVQHTPSLLNITDVAFDVADTNHFNVTIKHSTHSFEEFVNITNIAVTLENGIPQDLSVVGPPFFGYALNRSESVTFKCIWNWAGQRGKNVTVAAYALQGYSAYYKKATSSSVVLNVCNVSFSFAEMTRFNVTVENSKFSLEYVFLTRMAVVLDNGTVRNVTAIPALSLPYVLHPNQSVVFTCSWNWARYSGKDVAVVVYTFQGYEGRGTAPMPLVITDAVFNLTDTHHFNFTVQNSVSSIASTNITRITVRTGNESEIVLIETNYTLSLNSSVTFMCSWGWLAYQGQDVTISVYTSEGYRASATYRLPSE